MGSAAGPSWARPGRLALVAFVSSGVAILLTATAQGRETAPALHSSKPVGKAWPGHVITYFNTVTDQRQTIARAVAAWNTSGANVRFRAVSRAQAEVTIVPIPLNYPKISGGEASLGYTSPSAETFDPFPNIKFVNGRLIPPKGPIRIYHGAHIWLRHAADRLRGKVSSYFWDAIAVHEFGHILGLGHETRACATMNPISLSADQCSWMKTFALWQHPCALLAVDDIQGAIRLYGGHVNAPSRAACDSTKTPPAPVGLRAELDTTCGSLTLRWTLPLPRKELSGVIVKGSFDTCPTDPGDTRHTLTLSQVWTESTPASGSWCFTVWATRPSGQPSKPATVHVEVP
ncbi:MAG: matrixin family metalloprotease [Actinobacteria bacterium]|nr:matrixin family metalloprotease [Actinomycetota bacterium]